MIAQGISEFSISSRHFADHSISGNGNGSIVKRGLCWNENAMGNEGDIHKGAAWAPALLAFRAVLRYFRNACKLPSYMRLIAC